MKKTISLYFIFCIIVLSFSLPANVTAGDEKMRALTQTEREDLLSRLKSILAGIKTFEADFIEERTIKALPSPLTYEGTLYYERGHLFFMKYARPVQYILRVKGTEVTIYVVGSRTADIADMSTAKGGGGHTDIFDWDPSGFQGQIYSDADGFWLKEAAKKPGAPKLNILLDKKTILVKHFSIIGGNGDTTKITFSDKKINKPLPTEVLNYSLPKGTKLNRLSPP